jgi:hypothetical protein
MSPDNNDETKMSEQTMTDLERALEIIFDSDSLEDLCQRAVESEAANKHFTGAHMLLVSDGQLNYDCGFGQALPENYRELAILSIASHRVETSTNTQDAKASALVAVPFLVEGIAEAIGIVVLAPESNKHCLTGDLGQIVSKLTGFFLQKSIGLGH